MSIQELRDAVYSAKHRWLGMRYMSFPWSDQCKARQKFEDLRKELMEVKNV